MTTNPNQLRPDLASRVILREVLRDAEALGAAQDREASVAVAVARKLLREGSKDVDAVDCWAGVLALWITSRTHEGLL